MRKKPLLSIITVNLNDYEGLKKTVNSIFLQSWQEFEFIIIDGDSSDGSKEYIAGIEEKIDQWVSEPDSGIYNAMNKGIKAAQGDYLLFLNSGDILNSNNVLSKVSAQLNDGYDILYGSVQLSNNKKTDKNEVIEYPEKLSFGFFCNSTINHQAAFINRKLFKKYFYYNENLRLVSDWEFFICVICKYNVSYKKLKFIVINFDVNGISSNPINQEYLYKERAICLNNHFPLIMEDYKELTNLRSKLNLPVIKDTLELENYITARKIHGIILRFLLKLSKIKNNIF